MSPRHPFVAAVSSTAVTLAAMSGTAQSAAAMPVPGPVNRSPRRDRRPRRLASVAAVGAVALVMLSGVRSADARTSAVTSASVASRSSSSISSAVVTDWNRITFRTFTERALPVPVQGLQAGFVGAAVFNAVNTIEGRYDPYLEQDPAARGASVEAATATAAYRVLVALGPDPSGALLADYRSWLARVPDAAARVAGVEVGEDAAAALLAARTDDGRNASITLVTTPGPGVWDPPPTGMLVPWLGFVTPMVLRNQTSIPLSGPDALTSEAYAVDFNEVKRMGAKAGSGRTVAQTQLALFFNSNAVLQYNEALRDRLTRHTATASEAARAFGLLNLSTADALITCWRAKFDVHSWRPMQAIQRADTDGNPATLAQGAWEPLVGNPPYSEYASGHACITGAFSQTMARLYGPNHLDSTMTSVVTNTSRHYDTAAALNRDSKNARIWLGLHFRKAMDDGNRIGRKAANFVADHALLPRDSDRQTPRSARVNVMARAE